jgi:hypothetical protein
MEMRLWKAAALIVLIHCNRPGEIWNNSGALVSISRYLSFRHVDEQGELDETHTLADLL